MAPVLLCPECGTKHPLNGIGSRSAFPCTGCGRTLKVPAVAHAAADRVSASPPPAPVDDLPWPVASTTAPAMDPHATQTLAAASVPPMPPMGGIQPLPPPAVTARETPAPVRISGRGGMVDLIPPRPIRFLLWFVAVPVAFLVVFAFARAVGLLTTNEVTDVALASGWSRFWPIVRMLPFVALGAAGIVQGGVYGIAQVRASRRRVPVAANAGPGSRSRVRQSSRNGA
ncbi:MAG TPA: hypothetical protein VK771_04390 [Acidimicrobiia bacterium]|nr:hypothetical protein [Acidimicrobiia bacterium]